MLSRPLRIVTRFYMAIAILYPCHNHAFAQPGAYLAQSRISLSPFKRKDAQPTVVPSIVTVKLKSKVARLSKGRPIITAAEQSSLGTKLQSFGSYRIEKMFTPRAFESNPIASEISRILKVSVAEDLDPTAVAHELSFDPNVEYAEPVYVNPICEIPNDSLFSQQSYLQQMYAPEAWDWQKGDSSIVIAIVDNGTDYQHKDLYDNVWLNELEANGVNGIDDDKNGYIDDIHGWDFGNNDSNPSFISPDAGHGTAVAGMVCAAAGNRLGIAGASWNCKFMPIKCAADSDPSNILYGYEGIVYAVDQGADIINISWGTMGCTKAGQDVINYAYQKGVLVVCAAGNYSEEAPFYPASYHHTISVGALDMTDHKTAYSNYGCCVDLFAPGGEPEYGLITTIPQDEYGNACGTSFSSPLVAGICGLLLSRHPQWSPAQVMRQLFVTADDLTPLNPDLINKMGHGRLNALQALTRTVNPADELQARLNIISCLVNDTTFGNGNQIFEKNETMELLLRIQNFTVEAVDQVTVNISCGDGHVKMERGNVGPFIFPADTTLQLSLTFQLPENAPAGVDSLILTFKSGSGFHQSKKIYFAVGYSPILLLDHDLSSDSPGIPNVSYSYFQILKSRNVPFAYWDTGLAGFPEMSVLEKFPLLIVTTSSENSNFLIKYQRNIIRDYLDRGGNLLMAGQNIANYLANRLYRDAEEFLNEYLHVDFKANNSFDHLVQGVPNDLLTRNLSFQIWQPALSGDSQSPDVVEPAEGASTILTYGNGKSAAIKYAGAHKVVYLGFGIEAVDCDQNSVIGDPSKARTELVMRTLDWLNFLEYEVKNGSEKLSKPIQVLVKVPGNTADLQSITLFWRVQGDMGFTKTNMTKIETGLYSGEIPERYRGAKIEYYLQLHNDYYDWYSPIDAPESLHTLQREDRLTDITKESNESLDFDLLQNHPNPFNPSTTVQYILSRAGHVRMVVYDVLGRRTRVLLDSHQQSGRGEMTWDGTDERGIPVPAGMYFCRAETDEGVKVIKLALMR